MNRYIPLLLCVATSTHARDFFNECDQVLTNTIEICYDYEYKSPIAGRVTLDERVDFKNIKKRPSFKIDTRLPIEHRVRSSDYTNTGFDRGHFAGSDSSHDHFQGTLDDTYLMSNIVPQYPTVNRIAFVALEKYIRSKAVIEPITVTTLSYFTETPLRINGIAVPTAFAKVIYMSGVKECYMVRNHKTVRSKHLDNYREECSTVERLWNTPLDEISAMSEDDRETIRVLKKKYGGMTLIKEIVS